MNLYHADIRLPEGFRLPNRLVKLVWSRHAKMARLDDRYCEIPAFPVLDLGQCRVIEVGLTGRKVEKVVVRTELDDVHDVVFVLIPGNEWFVKTVWINERNDSHRTLDRSKYVC